MNTILGLIFAFFGWAIAEIAGLIGIDIAANAMDKSHNWLKIPRWLYILLLIGFVTAIYLGLVHVYRGMRA